MMTSNPHDHDSSDFRLSGLGGATAGSINSVSRAGASCTKLHG